MPRGAACLCRKDAMTERPILFSGPMIRAILDGRKTVTRRPIRRPKRLSPETFREALAWAQQHAKAGVQKLGPCDGIEWVIRPPCLPGDRLWVRETWRTVSSGRNYQEQRTTVYVSWREREQVKPASDCGQHQSQWVCTDAEHDALTAAAYGSSRGGSWRPSIHMPRWASRLTLEVVSVTVERGLPITAEEVTAEGFACLGDLVRAWDAIYGDGAAEAYPWVWRVAFRRVQ